MTLIEKKIKCTLCFCTQNAFWSQLVFENEISLFQNRHLIFPVHCWSNFMLAICSTFLVSCAQCTALYVDIVPIFKSLCSGYIATVILSFYLCAFAEQHRYKPAIYLWNKESILLNSEIYSPVFLFWKKYSQKEFLRYLWNTSSSRRYIGCYSEVA